MIQQNPSESILRINQNPRQHRSVCSHAAAQQLTKQLSGADRGSSCHQRQQQQGNRNTVTGNKRDSVQCVTTLTPHTQQQRMRQLRHVKMLSCYVSTDSVRVPPLPTPTLNHVPLHVRCPKAAPHAFFHSKPQLIESSGRPKAANTHVHTALPPPAHAAARADKRMAAAAVNTLHPCPSQGHRNALNPGHRDVLNPGLRNTHRPDDS